MTSEMLELRVQILQIKYYRAPLRMGTRTRQLQGNAREKAKGGIKKKERKKDFVASSRLTLVLRNVVKIGGIYKLVKPPVGSTLREQASNGRYLFPTYRGLVLWAKVAISISRHLNIVKYITIGSREDMA